MTSRAPVAFVRRGLRLRVDRGAGGVVTALGDLSRSGVVTWIAAAAGPDDRVVATAQRERGGSVGGRRLKLRFVEIAAPLWSDFYGTFCNRILWFVQHGIWSRRIDPEDGPLIRALSARYRAANEIFAEAVVHEALRPGPDDPSVMTHDYQLYELPASVRRRIRGLLVSHFVHIPWPGLETWRSAMPDDVCESLVRGLIGGNVVGFQDDASRRSFAGCVRALLPEADVREDRVVYEGRTVLLRVRPASVDPADLRPKAARVRELRADPRALIVRVDRVDPIKNVPLGFRAFGQLLRRRSDLVGKVRFVARINPSRLTVAEYAREWGDSLREAAAVNERYGKRTVEVVEATDRGAALAELACADVVLVNSVADGMNLVAKEAALLSEHGVLVLSRTAGAFAELAEGALAIDPASEDGTADALERALEMPEGERGRRAAILRDAVSRWTSRDWATSLSADLADAAALRGG